MGSGFRVGELDFRFKHIEDVNAGDHNKTLEREEPIECGGPIDVHIVFHHISDFI